jgi:hypothetical protein
LYSQGTAVFGSSNWTRPSDHFQQEHNFFSRSNFWIFDWFVKQFNRKWNNTNPIGAIETKAFTPLPPDVPKYASPSNYAFTSRTVRLTWYGGPWAHSYDIYLGTSSTPGMYVTKNLGPSLTTSQYQSYQIPFTLAPHTTYYWRIVSKTEANKKATGRIWSFTTGG